MEVEDPRIHSSGPFDPRACTNLGFECTGLQERVRGRQFLEHTADGSSWAAETGGPSGGVMGTSGPQVVSGINSSSCDVNGFNHLGRAHTIPHQDCAFHS